jgi:hypothetical protein
MKQHGIGTILLALTLAAGPYRAVLHGATLDVQAGEAVVRQAAIGADLPEAERAALGRGVWTVNDAGLSSFLEETCS